MSADKRVHMVGAEGRREKPEVGLRGRSIETCPAETQEEGTQWMGSVAARAAVTQVSWEGTLRDIRATAGSGREQARRASGTGRDGRSHRQGEVGRGAAPGGHTATFPGRGEEAELSPSSAHPPGSTRAPPSSASPRLQLLARGSPLGRGWRGFLYNRPPCLGAAKKDHRSVGQDCRRSWSRGPWSPFIPLMIHSITDKIPRRPSDLR